MLYVDVKQVCVCHGKFVVCMVTSIFAHLFIICKHTHTLLIENKKMVNLNHSF